MIPVPENATEPPPLTKFVGKFEPLTVMVWFVAPWPLLFGLTEEIVGRAVTVKQPLHDAEPPADGLVAVTFRVPVDAVDDTETFAVNCVLLFFVTEFTVIPLPENTSVPPKVPFPPPKPVPATVTTWFAAP